MLPTDRVHAIPGDIGRIIKQTQIIDKLIEVDVAPIITIVSTDSKLVLSFIIFIYFFELWFLSLKYEIISLMLLVCLLKLLTTFNFFLIVFLIHLFLSADG